MTVGKSIYITSNTNGVNEDLEASQGCMWFLDGGNTDL